jgi:hypothetical protein
MKRFKIREKARLTGTLQLHFWTSWQGGALVNPFHRAYDNACINSPFPVTTAIPFKATPTIYLPFRESMRGGLKKALPPGSH